MAHEVYLIGLWDDYMSFWMVDQSEWDKLSTSRVSLGEMEWKHLVIKELLDLTPEELEEFDQLDEESMDEYDCSFSLDQILAFVQDGKIKVLGTAEALQL